MADVRARRPVWPWRNRSFRVQSADGQQERDMRALLNLSLITAMTVSPAFSQNAGSLDRIHNRPQADGSVPKVKREAEGRPSRMINKDPVRKGPRMPPKQPKQGKTNTTGVDPCGQVLN